MQRGLRIAVVGLGFGAEFVPIYMAHPDVGDVGICDPDPRVLSAIGDRCGVSARFADLEAVLAAGFDAIHLVTPFHLHARQSIAVLEANMHCACTVPMALSIDDLRQVVSAQRRSGKNYMMMETAVYTREFLYVKDLVERGELGEIQLLRGAHYQDMENWPPYWEGLPPMYYATHAVAPLLALARTRATRVHCFGSGRLRDDPQRRYGNPYPAETAIFRLAGIPVAVEVTRTLFQTAREYTEKFDVYAERRSFEWQQRADADPVLFTMEPLKPGRGRPISAEAVTVPDRQDLLPHAIARFTRRGIYDIGDHHSSAFTREHPRCR